MSPTVGRVLRETALLAEAVFALRWGFASVGRFETLYKKEYGVWPGAVLES